MSDIISRIKSEKLCHFKNLKYFITHAFSDIDNTHSYNLSMKVGHDKKVVVENRQLLAESLGVGLSDILIPDQCHTNNIEIVKFGSNEYKETDALITNLPNVCLTVLAADCVPILLYDPIKNVIAAVHAGWRGIEKEIVLKTVDKMKQHFACNPLQMITYIGPSICSDCYQVGSEVVEKFRNKGYPNYIFKNFADQGWANIDLWEINRIQLMRAGLNENNIEISGICTFESKNLFSARRDGFSTGRFGVGIIMT